MSFLLADNSLNNLPLVHIATLNSLASSCFMFSSVSLEFSSIPAKVCNARFAIASLSRINELGTLRIASPLYTSFVASLNHCTFQKLSLKTIHMLCKIKHVAIKSETFFKCTSIIFNKIHHLPLSIPKVRSTHMRVELYKNIQ